MKQKNQISPQMIDEVTCEFQRIKVLPLFYKIKLMSLHNHRAKHYLNILETLMDPTIKFDANLEEKVNRIISHCEKFVGKIGISKEERIMITNAMGLKQGHWYKCPNGHVYCITECGGAVVEAKCPECKANIGGSHHQLRHDNQIANEMSFV